MLLTTLVVGLIAGFGAAVFRDMTRLLITDY